MLSIAQYAESRNVSQPAIRRQLKRYEKELEGHIIRTNRMRMLDDAAVAFLDQHRMPKTVIIEGEEVSLAGQVESLQKQVKRLQETSMTEQIDFLRKELKESQERVIQLQAGMIEMMKVKDENLKLIEDNQKKDAALTEKDAVIQAKDEELVVLDVTLHDVKDRLQIAEEEVRSFQKSLFGFYRKVKR